MSKSGFGATNLQVQVIHIRNNIFANNGPTFLPKDRENNSNNVANMGNQDGVGEYDTDLDNPSCADTTPNADRGKAITLNLFTTTYNVNQTPI